MKNGITFGLKAGVLLFSFMSAVTAMALPNLTPYKPTGWSDKIVVGKTTGTINNPNPTFTTADSVYINWAVINNGTTATGVGFDTDVYVDGNYFDTWTQSASMNANVYTYATDDLINFPLSVGTHSITIIADAGSGVPESNEADNSYTINFTVTAVNLPDLSPYQPAGWSDKIVVSTASGSITDSPTLTTADTLYIDWAVINSGNVAASNTFYTFLYVDGVSNHSWSVASLAVNSYAPLNNYSIGSLSAGSHTITITTDATGVIPESDESNNSYIKNITVNALPLPAPTPLSPPNGSTGQSTTPAFSWSAVGGAASYRIIVATNPADLPTDPTATSGGASVVINTTTATTSYTPGTPLNAGTTYYWEVNAHNGAQTGVWSSNPSFTTSLPPSGLTIIPTFDSSIANDPNAATIEATINSAIAVYQSSFSDPLTVAITFKKVNTGLGSSSYSYFPFPYSSYRSALISHATSADDTQALTEVPSGSLNPVNGNASVNINLALCRALGLNSTQGQPDGTISLNIAIMNLTSVNPDPSKYSLFAVASHEIDEVLGLGSALNHLNNGDPAPTGAISPEDLFRFDQNGARSFTSDINAAAYFSLDGTTDLARFNQHAGGDFSDWYSFNGVQATSQVQDAYSAPNSFPVLGVELRVLDALGYTRQVPSYVINASAFPVAGGTISPTGSFNKSAGSSQLFTASPNASYSVNQWLVDGNLAQAGGTSYTLSNIQTNHNVQVTFSQSKTNQTITFGALTNKTLGEPTFTVSATASSGLTVSFSILSGPATLSGNNVTITNTGTITVRASQAGNANYNPAPNVDQAFTVYPPPIINFTPSGQNLLITWPTNVAGYTLDTITNIMPPVSWTPALPTPVIVNGQYTYTNTPAAGNRFYRLRK
ncbi:MAG: hypothetical protein JWR19_1705 [Pedosphaera sp.]|nr:hypothetical protein [Pedosphaera sp.]